MARSFANQSLDTSGYPQVNTNSAFTVLAWCKTGDIGTTRNTIYSEGNNPSDGGQIYLSVNDSTTNKLDAYCKGTSAGTVTLSSTANTVNDDNWHLVIFIRRTTSNHELWFDGVLVASDTSTTVTGTLTTALGRIAATYDGTTTDQFFQGEIADVLTLSTALTKTNIYDLYHKTKHALNITTSGNYKMYMDLADNLMSNVVNKEEAYLTTAASQVDGPDGTGPTGMETVTLPNADLFEKQNRNMLTVGAVYDTRIYEHSNIVHTPADIGKEYKIWYSGHTSGNDAVIAMAYTTDPSSGSWTKDAGNPVIDLSGSSVNLEDPYVVVENGIYHLWCEYKPAGNNVVGYFTSPDGITWTLIDNNIIPIGAGGTWDDDFTASPLMLKHENIYYLFYEGEDGSNGKIGYATSSNIAGPWTKFGSNPVIGLSSSDWDTTNVVCDDIRFIDGKFWMLIHANSGSKYSCGVMTSTDLITWSVPTIPTKNQVTGTQQDAGMFYPINTQLVYTDAITTSPMELKDMYGSIDKSASRSGGSLL